MFKDENICEQTWINDRVAAYYRPLFPCAAFSPLYILSSVILSFASALSAARRLKHRGNGYAVTVRKRTVNESDVDDAKEMYAVRHSIKL